VAAANTMSGGDGTHRYAVLQASRSGIVSGDAIDWIHGSFGHHPAATIECRPGWREGWAFALPARFINVSVEENLSFLLYLAEYTRLVVSSAASWQWWRHDATKTVNASLVAVDQDDFFDACPHFNSTPTSTSSPPPQNASSSSRQQQQRNSSVRKLLLDPDLYFRVTELRASIGCACAADLNSVFLRGGTSKNLTMLVRSNNKNNSTQCIRDASSVVVPAFMRTLRSSKMNIVIHMAALVKWSSKQQQQSKSAAAFCSKNTNAHNSSSDHLCAITMQFIAMSSAAAVDDAFVQGVHAVRDGFKNNSNERNESSSYIVGLGASDLMMSLCVTATADAIDDSGGLVLGGESEDIMNSGARADEAQRSVMILILLLLVFV